MTNITSLPNNMYLVELTANEQHTALTSEFNSRVAQTTYNLYKELFALIKEKNLGTPTRIWNYVPRINEMSEADVSATDKERYRQFNNGRLRAFTAYAPRDAAGEMIRPAATGVGSGNDALTIYCLVTKDELTHIENARQTSVYHYPGTYGSSTPSFSRATLMKRGSLETVFISGTASIIHSETQHVEDVVKQTEESLLNIEYLLSEENLKKYHVRGFSLNTIQSLKVYVRNTSDYALIKQTIESKIDSHVPVIYVNRDICRSDLLVEIEGIATRG